MAEKNTEQQFYFVIYLSEKEDGMVLFHDISDYFLDLNLSNVSVVQVRPKMNLN